MSPPIRDGSGSSIGSIRLGDGSEISEVRTGAGDVVFSAGIPIPASGLERWSFANPNNDTSILKGVWNGRDGQVSGASYLSSGGPNGGGAFSFGGGDTINVSAFNAAFNPDTGSYTVAALIKTSSSGNFRTIKGAAYNDPRASDEFRKTDSDNLQFRVNDGGTSNSVIASVNVANGAWTWAVGVRDVQNSESRAYFGSSTPAATSSFSTVADMNTAGFNKGYHIGSTSNGKNWVGDIAECRRYDKALTDTEVGDLISQGSIL